MDENNNVIANDVTPETSTPATDPVAEATPVADPVNETVPAAELVREAAPVAVKTVAPAEPIPSTADIYEMANEAATNPVSSTPTTEPTEEVPVYYNTAERSPMDSFSVPSSTTYASTGTVVTDTAPTYSEPYTSEPQAPVSKGLGITSLVCGILSILFCCCCGNLIFSITGIICGCLQKPAENGKKPGIATAGIITSVVGILLLIVVIISRTILNVSIMDAFNDSFFDYYNYY